MFFKKPPELLRTPETLEAVREAFESTRELRRNGVTGFVLLKLTVAPDGSVESAKAVLPPSWLVGREHPDGVDETTGEKLPPPPRHTLHPDLCRAAERAAEGYRFRPGTLLGHPVRYRGLRHGFSFDAETA